MSHLPITSWDESRLFKYFVIGARKEKGENKDELLWELASDLTETNLRPFVNKLEVIDMIKDVQMDNEPYQIGF